MLPICVNTRQRCLFHGQVYELVFIVIVAHIVMGCAWHSRCGGLDRGWGIVDITKPREVSAVEGVKILDGSIYHTAHAARDGMRKMGLGALQKPRGLGKREKIEFLRRR